MDMVFLKIGSPILESDLIAPDAGPTQLTYAFPYAGVYALLAYFHDGNEQLVQATFSALTIGEGELPPEVTPMAATASITGSMPSPRKTVSIAPSSVPMVSPVMAKSDATASPQNYDVTSSPLPSISGDLVSHDRLGPITSQKRRYRA